MNKKLENPKIELEAIYGKNPVWNIAMPDGNKFRYSHGEMIPHAKNKKTNINDYINHNPGRTSDRHNANA